MTVDPTKVVPMGAWEQIAVVIVFAILIGGLGWLLVNKFSKAIAEINAHYTQAQKDSNVQWQQYFDARSEASNLVNQQIVQQLTGLTSAIADLAHRFDAHDQWERMMQQQDETTPAPRKRARS